MKIAITGGTGFVGRHLARALSSQGHRVVLIARGLDERDKDIRSLAGAQFMPIGTNDEEKLTQAFAGCQSVAHLAGINREIGEQTYKRVHIEGTHRVINAGKRAGVEKIAYLSFLRARPNCGSGYHESKWAAEELVRSSGLNYTVLKAGVIYGKGDHMLDHLSHAFRSLPIFGLVGMKDKPIRPTAVEDMVRVLEASLTKGRLSRQTVAVVGPEQMVLREAVTRVARVVGKVPVMFPLPVFVHKILARLFEFTMQIPLVSIGQVRILSEGIVEPLPFADALPDDLKPGILFSPEQIRAGLPAAEAFGWKDFRWSR